MNKPSERIVVFVSPAQKRAIAATADGLGISISELMRRAVMAFSATSDQVKAASIVDRLNAPREPDMLAQALSKAARPLRHGHGSALRGTLAAQQADEDSQASTGSSDASTGAAPLAQAVGPHIADPAQTVLPSPASPPAAVSDTGCAAREIAQAVARLTADADTTTAGLPDTSEPTGASVTPSPLRAFSAAVRPPTTHDEANEHRTGPAPEDGHFA